MCARKKPLLIVISAPSGAGKSTLCRRLLDRYPDMVYSVSCTTRAPRGGETEGVSYFFMTSEAFGQQVADGKLLEHAQVHGNGYGTLKKTVREALMQGRSLLLDIDVQGARQVRAALAALPVDDVMAIGFVDVFVHPPSLETLRARLYGRGEDPSDVVEARLCNAAREIEDAGAYRYQIVNDDLEQAVNALCGIVEKEQRS